VCDAQRFKLQDTGASKRQMQTTCCKYARVSSMNEVHQPKAPPADTLAPPLPAALHGVPSPATNTTHDHKPINTPPAAPSASSVPAVCMSPPQECPSDQNCISRTQPLLHPDIPPPPCIPAVHEPPTGVSMQDLGQGPTSRTSGGMLPQPAAAAAAAAAAARLRQCIMLSALGHQSAVQSRPAVQCTSHT
jgi:hypothetical protein